jgi:hypothetical protein
MYSEIVKKSLINSQIYKEMMLKIRKCVEVRNCKLLHIKMKMKYR